MCANHNLFTFISYRFVMLGSRAELGHNMYPEAHPMQNMYANVHNMCAILPSVCLPVRSPVRQLCAELAHSCAQLHTAALSWGTFVYVVQEISGPCSEKG